MMSNEYFLAKFRFDTAENEPAKNVQNFRKMHFRKNAFFENAGVLEGVREADAQQAVGPAVDLKRHEILSSSRKLLLVFGCAGTDLCK